MQFLAVRAYWYERRYDGSTSTGARPESCGFQAWTYASDAPARLRACPRRDAAGHREAADDLCFHSQCSTDPLLPWSRSLFSTLSPKPKIMLRVYFILLLAIGSNAVRNDDLAPAGGSSEDIDLARSRGYCDEADLDVTACIDSLEAAKKAVEELPASSTAAVKKQKEEEFLRAQSLLNDARNRRAQTHSAHASIVSARATKIAKNQTSTKGKEPAVDPAHNPKFLKR